MFLGRDGIPNCVARKTCPWFGEKIYPVSSQTCPSIPRAGTLGAARSFQLTKHIVYGRFAILSRPISILMTKYSFIFTASITVTASPPPPEVTQLDRHQPIQNAATRILLRVPKYSHIATSIQDELHCLIVRLRFEFKICPFVRNGLFNTDPVFLQKLRVGVPSNSRRWSLRSTSRGDHTVPRRRLLDWDEAAQCV